MIFHAIKILAQELNTHLNMLADESDDTVQLRNIAFHETEREKLAKDKVTISVFNVQQEPIMRNQHAFSRNPVSKQIEYHNPPVTVNVFLLFAFNAHKYEHAVIYQSRTLKFFQSKTIFTHKNVAHIPVEQVPEDEQLAEFKLIIDLYTPTFEEINHLWSVMGGKHLPFAIYKMRALDLIYKQVQEERGVIKEILITDKGQ
jgi:hypothetical protein